MREIISYNFCEFDEVNRTKEKGGMLPPSLEEMIDPNHPVRVVNQVIDSLDIDLLIKNLREEDAQAIIHGLCRISDQGSAWD